MPEIWRPVVIEKNTKTKYEISNFGKVKSNHAKSKIARFGGMLNPYLTHGYYCVKLTVTQSNRTIKRPTMIHSLVARAFLGPRPTSYHVNHKDGNKLNNSASNLEYVTAKQNNKHFSNLRKTSHNTADTDKFLIKELRDIVDVKYLAEIFNMSENEIKFIK